MTSLLYACVFLVFVAHLQPTLCQPNILLIVADDLGYGDLTEIYPNNSPYTIATPNLRSLADDGMKFTNAYAMPVCAPARCNLMTGRHAGHCTVRGNDGSYTPIFDEEVTVAELLQENGYRTGLFGKWGLGDTGSSGDPNRQGFDTFFGHDNQVDAHDWYPNFVWRNEQVVIIPENVGASFFTCGVNKQDCIHSEYLFVEEAISFMTSAVSQDQPFFTFMALTTPHLGSCGISPDGFPVPNQGIYEDENWPEVYKDYAASITLQDKNIGLLLQHLDDLNITDNTIVFYMSDNGATAPKFELQGGQYVPQFLDSTGGLREHKSSLHEGGIKVPMLVKWPDRIAPGSETDILWAMYDFLPTAADLAGISNLPENVDGVSTVPTLTNIPGSSGQEYLYFEFCSRGFEFHYSEGWGQAVRRGNWKAIRVNSAHVRLYNLETDPYESINLQHVYPDVVADLLQIMDEEHEDDEKWPSGTECCAGQYYDGPCV